jgi:DNA-binding SARP family transcriptional activator
MEVLIDRALENGNFETALDYTNQLIARDMLWEPAYSKLMGIYQRMGNIGMVQQVFQQYQLVMQQSLNSNVSVEFQRMYDELMHRKK